ncbi:MAG: MBL fold metallo-hydrolase [Nitrososphaeria archaeon]|jgi:glyoxylase-like metal-dependent hydrolase (beta-lactamase superfamily II)
MFFRQIKYFSDNFSYVIADEEVRESVVVDPSFNFDTIKKVLKENNLKPTFVINTHYHSDHTADNNRFKTIYTTKIVAHKISPIEKDIGVEDNDTIKVGKDSIKVIHTPGHTPDSICLLCNTQLLTGDTLFVGECGRTDLPGGSSKDMYFSLFNKLLKLDDNIEVYPGHDYGRSPSSTIGNERITNYVLKKRSLEEFIEFMGQP